MERDRENKDNESPNLSTSHFDQLAVRPEPVEG